MKPIPPAEARNKMPRNAMSAAIEKLNKSIISAAKRDQEEVRIDWLCDISGDRCELTELGRMVVEVYEKEGYARRNIYDCRQFVDVGMALTWTPTDPRGD